MSILTMHHGLMAGIKKAPVGNFVHIGQNDYPYVQIGNRLWITKNLKEYVSANDKTYSDETLDKYGKYYYTDDVVASDGVMTTALASLLPEGWMLARDVDFEALLAEKNCKTTPSKMIAIEDGGSDDYGLALTKAGYYSGSTATGIGSEVWQKTSKINSETRAHVFYVKNDTVYSTGEPKNYHPLRIVKQLEDVSGYVEIGDHEYPYVQIGSQLWTAKNLYEEFGSADDRMAQDASYLQRYGYVYKATYYTSQAFKDLLPDGWHVPSKAEYEALIAKVKELHPYASTNSKVAQCLGDTSFNMSSFISSSPQKGIDLFNLKLLPGGYLSGTNWYVVGNSAIYGTSTTKSGSYPYVTFGIMNNGYGIYFGDSDTSSYLSIRLVKDA